MPAAIVTGSGGLVGSSSVRRLVALGYHVVGIENDMRAAFFGPEASTAHVTAQLERDLSADGFTTLAADIRDRETVERAFRELGDELELVIHAAAQPSHDWAARDPHADFGVNAVGTLNLLEATRLYAPGASFIQLSTNKVYGDAPNELPLEETETRLELPADHRWYRGIDTSMRIDRTTHSLFGVSKTAADLLAQEYGRYFGLNAVCFRCGCITGADHAGTELHGFLAYLMRCAVSGKRYTVFGYDGKQVRDNIEAADLVAAALAYHASPRPGAVYNMGGGRKSNCSMLEAIELCEGISGNTLDWTYSEQARIGDHRWWISDLGEFEADYPGWSLRHDTESLLREIHAGVIARWGTEAEAPS